MSDDMHVHESAGAYVLGALTSEEAHSVEEHAATCALCRQEISELKQVVSVLPLAASSMEPSADLKARILAASKTEDKAGEVLRRGVVERQRVEPKRDFWHRPVPAWAGFAGWLGLAAACAVAGIFIGMTGEHDRMVSSLARLSAPTAAIESTSRIEEPAATRVYPVTTEDLSQAVALLDQSQVWDLSVAKTGERMPCKVIQPPHVSHAMIVTDMPPTKGGMVYRVWLVRKGKMHMGGIVMPGHGVQTIIPMRVQSGDVIAFSMEMPGASAVSSARFVMQQTL